MGNLVIGGPSSGAVQAQKGPVYVDLDMSSARSVSVKGRTLSPAYRIQKLVDVKAVQNALHQCFSWMPGERVLLPQFGSSLQSLLYEGIHPATEEKIVAEIRHCVSEWEPRIEITQVVNASTVEDTENNTIRLQVVYSIRGLAGKSFTYEHLYNKT